MKRIFETEGNMSFEQFMIFTRLMISGSLQEKSAFLFRVIARNNNRFFFGDLVEFFKLIGEQEAPNIYKSSMEEDQKSKEVLMTEFTWELMHKHIPQDHVYGQWKKSEPMHPLQRKDS